MNKAETVGILAVLETAYPRFYADKTEVQKRAALELWSTLFRDDDIKIVTEAVYAVICTLEFHPVPADIKKKIFQLTQPPAPSELEAWSVVRNAISYYDANENFNNLPPVLQSLVGSPNQLREWALLETKDLNTIIQSNFIKSYRLKVQQRKEFVMLPESSKQLISELSKTMLKSGESDANA